MPDVIKAALSTTLELATANSNIEAPKELQYMPPGTHRQTIVAPNAPEAPEGDGDDPRSGLLDKSQLQQKKIAEVRAANPQADFQTLFAKAQTEAPDLFR